MKTVVITGSSKGLGFAMAKEFLRKGCRVVLSGRSMELEDIAKSQLADFAGQYMYIPCNVQQIEEVRNLWEITKENWGNIDIWINNAGQNVPHEFIYNTQDLYIDNCIATNINGMIYGSEVAVKGMLEQKCGAVYSMEGLGSNNMIQKKTVLYGTTKHALTYFMKGLAKELEGTGVIAGRLSPGMMLTDFILKTPDGQVPAVESEKSFQKIFNILADRPETVAEFFIPRILENTRNDAHIVWLTNTKSVSRFLTWPINKRKLV